MEYFLKALEISKNPVVYNGDIFTGDSYKQKLAQIFTTTVTHAENRTEAVKTSFPESNRNTVLESGWQTRRCLVKSGAPRHLPKSVCGSFMNGCWQTIPGKCPGNEMYCLKWKNFGFIWHGPLKIQRNMRKRSGRRSIWVITVWWSDNSLRNLSWMPEATYIVLA